MKAKILEHLDAYWRLYLSVSICLFCICVSFGGVWWAVKKTHCDADAGRGGAIADAVALFVIFLDRSYAASLYTLISGMAPIRDTDTSPIDRAAVRRIVVSEIERFEKLLSKDAKLQRLQNFFLALATLVGTGFWGFGDLWARHYLTKCP
jgi:hypothetical protein